MPDLGEFELIERFFTRPARRATLGVGDDCALLQTTPGTTLAVSTDMPRYSTALPSASRPLLGRPSVSPTGVTSSGGK